MSVAILLGAGASYGSDDEGTPPLGVGLFDQLQRFNPDGWGQIGGELAALFRSDFEHGLASVDERSLAPLQRAMAAYFFQFQPRRSNRYFVIAQRIAKANRWNISFTTLNYERLLEVSLIGAGIQPTVGGGGGKPSRVELCFPHGCCHIFCDGVRGTAGGVSFGRGVQTNGAIRVVSNPSEHRHRVLTDAFPPVMSYFDPKKHTTSGASFIESQRRRWAELALQATKLVIIGVAVRVHDDHIWGPISRSDANITYCGGPAGGEEFGSWSQENRPGRQDVILPGFFGDELENLCGAIGA